MNDSNLQSGQRPRILVADDDHLLTAVAAMALQSNGFQVVEAKDGAAALNLIDDRDFDLVLLDLEMPNVSGFQVLEEVRAHRRLQYLPIIVVTSRADPVAIERSYKLGATSFVVKPIKWNVMVHHIRYAIRTSRMAAELRASKREAEHASQLKGNLLSMISHEFRTPIHAINGFSNLIEQQICQAPQSVDLRSNLDEITRATSRLNAILADILLVSSNINGTANLEEDDHRISDLIGDMPGPMKGDQTSHNIKVAYGETLSKDDEIYCDRDMFLRAGGHIIDNAMKFSPAGSTISVRADISERGELVCTIGDQGRGMSDGEIKNALILFSQIDMSSTRSANGLGMGLTISNMICDAHGGRINITAPPSGGTEVSLIFPAGRVTRISQEYDYAVA